MDYDKSRAATLVRDARYLREMWVCDQRSSHAICVISRLLLGLFFVCVVGVAQAQMIPDSERQALLDLYGSTGGSSWTTSTNWMGAAGTECTWFGVICDGTGSTVVQILLDNNNLDGSLPALDAFTNLQTISINSNPLLTGSLPPLAGLGNLVSAFFEHDNLSGTIPSLAGMTNLQNLYLDANGISGPIPSLAGLTNLQVFSAVGNQLSGSIPPLGGLTSLNSLWLAQNKLSGQIPPLSGLTNLIDLDLRANQFSGPIPSFAGLGKLELVTLDGNSFAGSLPSLADLTSLQSLTATNANLSGQLPSLAGLVNLQSFKVGSNQFTGSAPAVPGPPNDLVAGQSSLCPNLLTHSPDNDWNAATGSSPWYATCVSATSTSVTSSQNPSMSGHSVTFTASVSSAYSPTGTVAFKDGTNVICAASTITSGSATCMTSTLSFGTHQITAVYSGDSSSNTSTSTALTQTVDFVGFVPLVPARLLDTRPGFTTIDGQFAGAGPVSAQTAFDLAVLNRGGIPVSGVDSVVLNVTVTTPTAAGFLTVWPSGNTRPLASNLNFVPSETVPNLVIAKLGSNGKISIFNSAGSTNVIADVVGYFTTGSDLTSLVPERLLDTRSGATTIDGLFAGIGALQAQSTLNLTILNRTNIPPSGVGTVVLNVTVANPSAAGFVTAWPADNTRPLASNLNFVPGEIIPNLVVAQVGTNGQVSLFNSAGSTDLVADIVGWFPPTPELTSLLPARVLDTRPGFTTIDGQFAGIGPVPGQTSIDITVVGRGGVPASGVGAVILNVTVTTPTVAGFLTVWPTGSARPLASNLNFIPAQTIPNLVFAEVGADGKVSVFNSAGSSNVVADVVGWFPPAP